jgi:hypothetical protein
LFALVEPTLEYVPRLLKGGNAVTVPLAIDVRPLKPVAVRVAVFSQSVGHSSRICALKNVSNRRPVGEKIDAMAVWDPRAEVPLVPVALEGLRLVKQRPVAVRLPCLPETFVAVAVRELAYAHSVW